MKKDFWKKEFSFSRIELLALFLYFLAILVLPVFHEPWEDELQAWCIARDLSLPEMFHQMRYEGQFILWYLLMKPFAAAGLPVSMLNLVSVFLTAAAVIPFMMARGFRTGFKIVILLSAPILYWFPVVARCYALIPLALCLLAGSYPLRLKRPFCYVLSLLLLVYSHAYMEGLAGILGAFFLWELMQRCFRMGGRRRILTFAGVLFLITAGVVLAALQVLPAFGASSFAPSGMGSIFADPAHIPLRIWQALLKLPEFYAGHLCRICGKELVSILFYLCLLAAVVQLFITRGRAGLFFLTGFLWQILFSALLYPMMMHRAWLPLLMLIFCFALPVRREKRKLPKLKTFFSRLPYSMAPVLILALMTFPDSLYFVVSDVERPFSNQYQTASFIQSELPSDAKIVVFPASLITGTFRAYLPERIFYRCTDGEPFRVFQTVGKMPEKLDNALLEEYMENGKDVYLLFQMGAFLTYWPPRLREQYYVGDFVLEPVFCSFPNCLFHGGRRLSDFPPDPERRKVKRRGKEREFLARKTVFSGKRVYITEICVK